MPKLVRIISFKEWEEEKRLRRQCTIDKLLETGIDNIHTLKKSDEWNRQDDLPKRGYIIRRFGSWGNFRKAVYSKKRNQILGEHSKTKEHIFPSWINSGLSQLGPEDREEFLRLVDENSSDIFKEGYPKLITIRQWDYSKKAREAFSELNTLPVCSFLSIMFLKHYWDTPLETKHKNQSCISLRKFASNYDPISGKNLGLNKGTYAALIGRWTRYLKQTNQNLSFVEFMVRGLDHSLAKKVRRLNDGTRLREHCIERYVHSFWYNPLPEFNDTYCWKSRPLNKHLANFVVSWDHIKNVHSTRCGQFKSLKHHYETNPEIKSAFSFFDWMTQGLNPELVRKARLIDSGERAEQYLEEKIQEGAEQYVRGVV